MSITWKVSSSITLEKLQKYYNKISRLLSKLYLHPECVNLTCNTTPWMGGAKKCATVSVRMEGNSLKRTTFGFNLVWAWNFSIAVGLWMALLSTSMFIPMTAKGFMFGLLKLVGVHIQDSSKGGSFKETTRLLWGDSPVEKKGYFVCLFISVTIFVC